MNIPSQLNGARVLHVIQGYTVSLGGSLTTMHNIATMCESVGATSHVLTLETAGKKFEIAVAFTALRPSFPVRISNSVEAARWLHSHHSEFDLIVFHCVWSVVSLRLAAVLRRNGRRYVVVPHGSLDPFDLKKKVLLKGLLGPVFVRRFLQNSAAVLCSTQREADCLVTYGAKCNVVVIPWPIALATSQFDRTLARRQIGCSERDFVVLSLGRVDYKKGFPVLLPAIGLLAQSGIPVRLLIVGPDSGGYSSIVRDLIHSLRLAEFITMLPMAVGDEKAALFRAADCFALPSLNENFGNVVVEAMQQGLPCVISNNVYICDEVERGGAGFVCEYDERQIFAALKELAADSVLRAKMASAAIRLARSFEPAALRDRYRDLLTTLLAASGE